jgi:hypothetical protein
MTISRRESRGRPYKGSFIVPFALPDDKSVNFGPETILERPALAARVGQIANAWNIFELGFARTYAFMVAKQAGTSARPGTGLLNSNPAGLQIFDTLDSFRSRQDLFVLLLKAILADREPDVAAFYGQVVAPRIAVARLARDKIVRGAWGVCSDYPDGIVRAPLMGQSEVYLESDLKDELATIIEAATVFEQLRSKLFDVFV